LGTNLVISDNEVQSKYPTKDWLKASARQLFSGKASKDTSHKVEACWSIAESAFR